VGINTRVSNTLACRAGTSAGLPAAADRDNLSVLSHKYGDVSTSLFALPTATIIGGLTRKVVTVSIRRRNNDSVHLVYRFLGDDE